MKCKQCGTKMPNPKHPCVKCGWEDPRRKIDFDPTDGPVKRWWKTKKKPFIILVCVCVIAVIGAIIGENIYANNSSSTVKAQYYLYGYMNTYKDGEDAAGYIGAYAKEDGEISFAWRTNPAKVMQSKHSSVVGPCKVTEKDGETVYRVTDPDYERGTYMVADDYSNYMIVPSDTTSYVGFYALSVIRDDGTETPKSFWMYINKDHTATINYGEVDVTQGKWSNKNVTSYEYTWTSDEDGIITMTSTDSSPFNKWVFEIVQGSGDPKSYDSNLL